MSTEAIAVEKPKRNYNVLFGLTLLALLVLLWILLSVTTTSFASANNIANLLRQGSMIAIMAVGQTFVIITGGIDLSVGAVVGFATVVVAMMINAGFPIWLAILVTLLVGVAIGMFHGFGIVKMGLPPFIITLATLTSLRGIGLLMTNGNSININSDTFTAFSRNSFIGIPNLFWMVILVGIPAYIFLHHSRWGRYLFSVGSNAEASRLSGVNVQRTIYMAYTLSGLCAAFVGVLLAARIGIGNPTQAVEVDDDDDQRAGDDALPERIDVEQVGAVVDGGQDEGAEQR
ncbi:ABC transporter permease, partial [Mesorhizobium sp. M7A.F.Ca.AU.002.06.1.1]|uniref:ABC transporter permease n=1 Tax=Mesorhizobium sp. M7A.F.Ca.AU.002.06.1.1 TaxID=2496674 RepID=UPI001FE11A9A